MDLARELFSNLVIMAYADNILHDDEVKTLNSIGQRLGMSPDDIRAVLQSRPNFSQTSFSGPVVRYKFLEDLLDVMMADGKIQDEEVELCQTMSTKLGFDPSLVNELVKKIKVHFDKGFDKNKVHDIIDLDISKIISGSSSYDRFD